MTSPGRDTWRHRLPPLVVAHRPGLNSQPSRALENRTVLTFDSGGAVNGGTSDTAGAGTQVQVLPPLTVLRNSALHGRTLQRRVPSTNPVRADTKLAEEFRCPLRRRKRGQQGPGKAWRCLPHAGTRPPQAGRQPFGVRGGSACAFPRSSWAG